MDGQTDTQINPAVDDLEIDTRPDPGRSRQTLASIRQSLRDFATLSEALRILGAIVMLASMSVFLLQGWNEGNDIRRYLLLLSQTGLLTAGGFALSYGLKENKGARIFFGLALISIPANFTILGALLYSVTQWDGGLVSYPQFATWQIARAGSTGITLGGALLAMIPLTLLGFAIFARRSARALTMHFLLLNALLWLPMRGSTAAGVLAFTGVLYALWSVRRISRSDRTLNTPEGKFALLTLFIPMGIIVFRSMYFYQVDSMLLAMLSLAVFLGVRQVATATDRSDRVALALDLVSVPVAMIAATAVTVALEAWLPVTLLAPVFACVFAGLGLDVARRTGSRVLAAWTSALVSVLVGASFIFNVLEFSSALSAIVCLLAGAVMVLAGRGVANGLAVFMGFATVSAGLLFGFGELLALVRNSGWVELALFGASAIAVGSVLDRHGATLRLRFGGWLAGFGKSNRA